MHDVGWQHLVFPGDGEMMRRMREHPWEASALGDPRDWPSHGPGAQDGPGFTVDLCEVDYLDSAGLTVLLPHAPRLTISPRRCSARCSRSAAWPRSPR